MERNISIITYRRETKLIIANQLEAALIASLVLMRKADVNAQDEGGYAALHYAMESNTVKNCSGIGGVLGKCKILTLWREHANASSCPNKHLWNVLRIITQSGIWHFNSEQQQCWIFYFSFNGYVK